MAARAGGPAHGLVVGSGIGGALASHFGITTPFWFAFGGSALFVLLLWRQLTRVAHDDAHPTDNSQAAARQQGQARFARRSRGP